MRELAYLVLAFVALPAAAAGWSGRVVNIHDGDTMTVLLHQQQIKVRLDSIDAPELGQAFGENSAAKRAKAFTAIPIQPSKRRVG